MCRSIFHAVAVAAVLLIVAMQAAEAESNWVSLDTHAKPAKPTVTILHSNNEETLIRITISGFWCEDVTEEGETFQMVRPVFPDSLPG